MDVAVFAVFKPRSADRLSGSFEGGQDGRRTGAGTEAGSETAVWGHAGNLLLFWSMKASFTFEAVDTVATAATHWLEARVEELISLGDKSGPRQEASVRQSAHWMGVQECFEYLECPLE